MHAGDLDNATVSCSLRQDGGSGQGDGTPRVEQAGRAGHLWVTLARVRGALWGSWLAFSGSSLLILSVVRTHSKTLTSSMGVWGALIHMAIHSTEEEPRGTGPWWPTLRLPQ